MEIPHQTVQCNFCTESLPISSARCSECKTAHYCSPKCQSDDWTVKHGLECIGMKTQREEAEKRAVSRLNRASAALSPRGGGILLDRAFNMENDEGHLRRLRRYRETAKNVVEPGTVLRIEDDRRAYGVGTAVDPATGENYLVTAAGYTQMRGKYSFLQDTEGNVFRRRYLVPTLKVTDLVQFDPSVWWETFDRTKKAWVPLLPKGTDPETRSGWEIYIP